jgi:hypothetical protein
MTDALRSDRPSTTRDAADRERDARIEELLLTGLDHYFAGEHELAINVWTRVLFLDRGHAKARAYIERARGAVSELQREAEELFHTAAAALNRGDRAAARQLLTSAIDRGASGEEALALLHRLDRLEASTRGIGISTAQPPGPPQRRVEQDEVRARRDPRVAWVVGGILAGILIAAVAGGYLWIIADPFELGDSRAFVPKLAEDPLPVPSPGEIRLLRARALVAAGHLREALAMLDAVAPDEQHRASFEELRGAIQRRLLDAARQSSPGAGGPGTPESPATGLPQSPDSSSSLPLSSSPTSR